MKKKLELYNCLFFETTFLDINESFGKYSKQNLRMAESSRLLSPNKKKIKRSKLVEAATNKTTFKPEKKKQFPSIASVLNNVSR